MPWGRAKQKSVLDSQPETLMSLKDTLYSLEQYLLHSDFSDSPEKLEALIAEAFREVSPNGEVISRESVLNWLIQKDAGWRWEFSNFKVQSLGEDVELATYHARQTVPAKPDSKGAMHCSVWVRNQEDAWQMQFHQSTRIK